MLLLLNVLESVNHEVIICSSRGLCWNPSPESGVLNPTHLSFLLKKKKKSHLSPLHRLRLLLHFSCGSCEVFIYFFQGYKG